MGLDDLRDGIQIDVGRRGLAGLFAAFPGDFAAACRALADAGRVGVVTGFFIPGPDCYETDGPPGSAFLVRTLLRCGIDAVALAEPGVHAALRAGGVEPLTLDEAPPLTHVVVIERPGPAADGRCYTMRGRDVTAHTPDVRPLLAGRVTVGIGDGGNEVGMGKVPAAVIAREVPRGDAIACRVATDHLIVAGISNWGAYALGVGVARVLGFVADLDVDHEHEVLRRMVADGELIDGVTGEPTVTVDGLAWDEYARPLRAMA